MGFKEISSVHVAFMRRASAPASTAAMADPEGGKEVPPCANPGQSAAWVPRIPQRTHSTWAGLNLRRAGGRDRCVDGRDG